MQLVIIFFFFINEAIKEKERRRTINPKSDYSAGIELLSLGFATLWT